MKATSMRNAGQEAADELRAEQRRLLLDTLKELLTDIECYCSDNPKTVCWSCKANAVVKEVEEDLPHSGLNTKP